MEQKQRTFETILLFLADLSAMGISFFLAVLMRYHTVNWETAEGCQSQQLWVLCVVNLIVILVTNLYDSFFLRNIREEAGAVLRQEILLMIFTPAVLYLIHDTIFSRKVFACFLLMNCILTLIFRQKLKSYLDRVYRKERSRQLILVTTREEAYELITALQNTLDWSYSLKGIILADEEYKEAEDTKASAASGERTEAEERRMSFATTHVVAGRSDLPEYLLEHQPGEVFFAYRNAGEDPLLPECLRALHDLDIPVDLRIFEYDLLPYGRKSLTSIGKYKALRIERNNISPRGQAVKRLTDLLVSLPGLVLFGLTALIVGPLIRRQSGGPVLSRQIKVGFNGRPFTLYKFNVGYGDPEKADGRMQEMAEDKAGSRGQEEEDPDWFLRDRSFENPSKDRGEYTKIGRFLHRTHLEGLPQFWNILKGDMSLVGTQPLFYEEFQRYEEKHRQKIRLKPGLTGLWRVEKRRHRGDLGEVIQMDLRYVDNWSIAEDLEILLRTMEKQ